MTNDKTEPPITLQECIEGAQKWWESAQGTPKDFKFIVSREYYEQLRKLLGANISGGFAVAEKIELENEN